MSDRDDDKIVSLDQRRRAEQARQKAEIAAAARRKKANGSGERFNRPFGQPMRAARPPMSASRAVGTLLAWLVWGGLAAIIALAAYGWMMHPAAH